MCSKQLSSLITTLCVLFTIVLFAFACGRATDDDRNGHDDGDEMRMHEEDEAATNHGEHNDTMAGTAGNGEAGVHSGDTEHVTIATFAPIGTMVDGVRVIEVTARKFAFEPQTIVVEEGDKVRLKITSEDVTHGFGLEAYDIDRKLPPNETQTIEFTADQAGVHHFHCSVYCGDGHGDMHGQLIVNAAK